MKSKAQLILSLHDEAMEYADDAFFARRAGDVEGFVKFSRLAYEKEAEAARMIASKESEPTRSVLHRSAATLALDCGEYREAERLIAIALAGNPPNEIADELRELFEKVNFERNLKSEGIQLDENELQLSVQGSKIGYGLAPVQSITARVSGIEKLVQRTANYKNGHGYTDTLSSNIRKNYGLYLSASFIPGSFNVVLRLERTRQPVLLGLGKFDEILNTLMENIGLLNQGKYESLRQNISDPAYFRNFVGIAKKIAPDGSNVSAVGLRAVIDGRPRRVSFERNKRDLNNIPMPKVDEATDEIQLADETTSVTGVLKYADALKSKNEVRLLDKDNKTWTITVPEGLMRDVVRPYFDENVQVMGKRIKGKRKSLYLVDIDSLE